MGMSSSTKKDGDSREQIRAHEYIREEIAREPGLDPDRFPEKRISVGDSYVVVTGLSRDPNIVCEASARIGNMRSAQVQKIMNNALKMHFLEQHLGGEFRKILAFIDEEASSKFVDNGWHGDCLRRFGIEVMVVDVPERIKGDVLQAQERQYR